MKYAKKILLLMFVSLLFSPQVGAFRDVPEHSSLTPAINDLMRRGVLEDGAFLRPEEPVPAQMFWEVVLRDAGFNPHSSTFNTPVPPNVREDAPIAQFLREAIRRGFIPADEPFDFDKLISRTDAIKILITTKAILPPRAPSLAFKKKVAGAPKHSDALRYIEAAYASKILEDTDIAEPFFEDEDYLIRRDLIRWLYNFSDHGEKQSTIQTGTSLRRTFRSSRANVSIPSSSAREKTPSRTIGSGRGGSTEKSKNVIRIQTINGNPSEVRQNDSGLLILNGRIFESVYRAIENKFRFPEKLTRERKLRMTEAAIAGMVEALEDKYSVYIESSKSQEFKEGLNGKFEGIGAYVEMIDGKFTITAPITGSPAEDAGILPGDIVTKVNGESIESKNVNDIVSLIRGEAGTNVTLTIQRNETNTVEITVTRGKITVPSITLKWEKSIPIVGIHRFANNTTEEEFKRILTEEILPRDPRGIVLDLRNNPGGFLNSAVTMTEFLLDRDELIFTVDYRDSKQEYRSSRRGELYGRDNIIILLNKGSASASEIFAAAAQDYKRAKILGEKSHGKGTVQEIITYPNEEEAGSLKLTVAKWLTPFGRWIQEGDDKVHGVIPDIPVTDQTVEQKKAGIDPMVDKAINVILNK